ncbi:MAG: nucleotide exchange factor GrpE [Pontimonas sp.]|mgnify:CR=1 FL=1|jgi:molecular chaperone GrpE
MARDSKSQPERDEEPQEPLVTDKRRIDPETGDVRPEAASAASEDLSEDDMALLQEAERDLVAEYRDRAARAEAELQNFRTRVERDRQANREMVIAEVIRSLLPVMDDLDRAEAHGDLAGTPLELVAQKLRSTFERYEVKPVGEVGEAFDPAVHEAMVRIPEDGAEGETVADVIEGGYTLGERLIRAAKVAVKVPADE